MKNVLVIGQHDTMLREMPVKDIGRWGYSLSTMSLASLFAGGSGYETTKRFIQEIVSRAEPIDGVIAMNDGGAFIAALIALKLGLPGPNIRSVLHCLHKYYSRQIQKRAVSAHTPECLLVPDVIDTDWEARVSLPAFLKPAHSRMSFYSFKVRSKEELGRYVRDWNALSHKPSEDVVSLWPLLSESLHREMSPPSGLILEELIEAPYQVTVDGYVHAGSVTFFGVTRSDFLSGTISFESFHFPDAQCPPDIEERMHTIARTLVAAMGLDDTLFNVEFKYNPETGNIWIIEINCRLSIQFGYMIEQVRGVHPLHIGLAIACGDSLPLMAPLAPTHRVASCFILRRTTDARILRVPSRAEVEVIEKKFAVSTMNSFVAEGERLSDYVQDVHTYRYAQIKVVGRNEQENRERCQKIRQDFDPLFQFEGAYIK